MEPMAAPPAPGEPGKWDGEGVVSSCKESRLGRKEGNNNKRENALQGAGPASR